LLLVAPVGRAHENERVGGKAALQKLAKQGYERLCLILADAGYDGLPLVLRTRDRCVWKQPPA
jgi:hypothetical protein